MTLSVSFRSNLQALLRWVSRTWLFWLLSGLTLILHRALLPQFGSAIPNDPGDPLLNTWILWWNAQHLPFTAAYWHAPSFAPAPYALALSETLLGLTWMTTPLQWMGFSPLVAYNTMFVAIPVLNGLSAYWLCLTLTGRRDAALVGCLVFAFAPYHANQVSHLQTKAMFFMPLALVGLHRYWQTGQRRWLGLLSAAVALNGLVCGYFLLYFSVVLGLAIVWLTVSSRDTKKLVSVAVALVLSAAVLAPVALTFRSVRNEWNLRRSITEIEFFSADLTSIVNGSQRLTVWPINTEPGRPEVAEYPGVAVTALLIAAAIVVVRQRRHDVPASPWRRRTVFALMFCSAVAIAIGLVTWMGGGGRPYKPIGVGLDFAILAALLSSRFAAMVRSGSIGGLYATGALAASLFALGPVGRVLGHRFWYKAPFSWLMTMPGFDAVRVPALFGSVQVLCLAVIAAVAVVRLFRAPTPRALAAVAVLSFAIVLDGWATVSLVPVPGPVPVALDADLVVELPTRGWQEDAAAMYRGITHRRPVVNGYSGYAPPHYEQLQRELRNNCVESLDEVRGGRSLDVVVWRNDPDAGNIDAAVRAQWGDERREETPEVVVYRVPRSASVPTRRSPTAGCGAHP
jgi:hypothetical protein